MKEGNPVRIPIRVLPDELAPESIPALPMGDVFCAYTPMQMDRLNAFRHMLRAAKEAEKDEKEYGRPLYWGQTKDGRVTEQYIHLDATFQLTIFTAASHLYETEFLNDPIMKEAADAISDAVRVEFDGPHSLSTEQLEDLYDR